MEAVGCVQLPTQGLQTAQAQRSPAITPCQAPLSVLPTHRAGGWLASAAERA